MRAMSSTSLMRLSRWPPAVTTWLAQSRCAVSESGPRKIRPKPRMALSGVRSSWLMRERNSLLAALAFSASSLACWSAASVRSRRAISARSDSLVRSSSSVRRWMRSSCELAETPQETMLAGQRALRLPAAVDLRAQLGGAGGAVPIRPRPAPPDRQASPSSSRVNSRGAVSMTHSAPSASPAAVSQRRAGVEAHLLRPVDERVGAEPLVRGGRRGPRGLCGCKIARGRKRRRRAPFRPASVPPPPCTRPGIRPRTKPPPSAWRRKRAAIRTTRSKAGSGVGVHDPVAVQFAQPAGFVSGKRRSHGVKGWTTLVGFSPVRRAESKGR